MALDFTGLVNAAVSHAQTLGLFEGGTTHEPKSAPGSGRRWAIWLRRVGPAPGGSGLISTTGRVELTVRVYQNMLAEPQDEIDADMAAAIDALFVAYSGDFTLGGLAREVDLLGEYGAPLSGEAGYLPQDGRLYRVFDIALPLIVNDLWEQAP